MSEDYHEFLETSQKEKWEKIGTKKKSGVLVPLFSIYSEKSLGIGEFDDLKLMVDWCKKTGNSIIQLLPMNEMGGLFCPYDAESSFALESVYISLSLIDGVQKRKIQDKINELHKSFSTGKEYVNYQIKHEKLEILWDIFQNKKQSSQNFKKYIDKNNYWLHDFALFKVLKSHHKGKPWYEWDEIYKNRDSDAISKFLKDHQQEINFHKWVQWLLFQQFSEAREYSCKNGILLKGDLPVLVSRDSADVWSHPEYFKMDLAAGAPPDMYVALGQRWGMPTYNWDKIAEDDYIYIKEKLRYAENFYDLLRIDHVVGLFRIWSIPVSDPLENQGINGYFDPSEEWKWEEHGRTILSIMCNNTSMLLCAEDLGVIPEPCPRVLGELGIPGNDVQRWMKDWNESHDFLPPQDYRKLAVAMLSTHDTLNWASWWIYQAGCIDEELFKRMCSSHGINFELIKSNLFNLYLSRHGYLRWHDSMDSHEKLAGVIQKPIEEIGDILNAYDYSFKEKEKLWNQFNLDGALPEKCNYQLISAALKTTLSSSSIFNIEIIFDWLFLTDLLKVDPWTWRINTPGTISDKNWSIVIPVSLEELLKHPVCNEIKRLIGESGRA